MKKIFVLSLCVIMTVGLCSCKKNATGNDSNKEVQTENVSEAETTKEETTKEETIKEEGTDTEDSSVQKEADSTNAGTDDKNEQVLYTCEELGCQFSMSQRYAEVLQYTVSEKTENTDFNTQMQQADFYIEQDGVKQPLFSIYCLDGTYTAAEVDGSNPDMGFLKVNNQKQTYTIGYVPEAIEEASEDLAATFVEIMNKEVSKIPESFALTE